MDAFKNQLAVFAADGGAGYPRTTGDLVTMSTTAPAAYYTANTIG